MGRRSSTAAGAFLSDACLLAREAVHENILGVILCSQCNRGCRRRTAGARADDEGVQREVSGRATSGHAQRHEMERFPKDRVQCRWFAAAAPASGGKPANPAAPVSASGGKSANPATPAKETQAPAGNAVFPPAVSPKYSSELAGKARMHTCLDQYNANKANNANGGLHWIPKRRRLLQRVQQPPERLARFPIGSMRGSVFRQQPGMTEPLGHGAEELSPGM